MSSKAKSAGQEHSERYVSVAVGRLKSYGLRVTKPRLRVIQRLSETDHPVSTNDIYEGILADGGKIDMVSVYRILSALHELGLVHHVGVVNAYMPCQLDDEHSHSSKHFVCENCGRITEMPLDPALVQSIEEELSEQGYSADTVKLEVLGLCPGCKTKRA